MTWVGLGVAWYAIVTCWKSHSLTSKSLPLSRVRMGPLPSLLKPCTVRYPFLPFLLHSNVIILQTNHLNFSFLSSPMQPTLDCHESSLWISFPWYLLWYWVTCLLWSAYLPHISLPDVEGKKEGFSFIMCVTVGRNLQTCIGRQHDLTLILVIQKIRHVSYC